FDDELEWRPHVALVDQRTHPPAGHGADIGHRDGCSGRWRRRRATARHGDEDQTGQHATPRAHVAAGDAAHRLPAPIDHGIRRLVYLSACSAVIQPCLAKNFASSLVTATAASLASLSASCFPAITVVPAPTPAVTAVAAPTAAPAPPMTPNPGFRDLSALV